MAIENEKYDDVLTGSVGKSGFFMLKVLKNENSKNSDFAYLSEHLEILKLDTIKEYYDRFSQQIAKDDIRLVEKDSELRISDSLNVFRTALITLNMSSPEMAPHAYDICVWQSGDFIYELEVSYFRYLEGPEAECAGNLNASVSEIIQQTLIKDDE